ncbi:MAG: BspA family leucine-rich repeat surface protein [Prevotella sp.]|nr:BspA family leucine-rich repeat surface protein [Prevotella sp.]
MKLRIIYIIILLLTMLGGARAENTFTIKVSHNYSLSYNERIALTVLANYEQAITITGSYNVSRDGVELFSYDSNYYISVPATTSSANNFTHTISASTQALIPALYPSLAGYTSIAVEFWDPIGYVEYDSTEKSLTFRCDHEWDSSYNDIDYLDNFFKLNYGTEDPEWSNKFGIVTSVKFHSSFANARPTSCYKWFYDSDITSITGLNYLNTSEVTNMSHMFDGCYSVTKLNVSSFNTAKVTDMSYMFEDCGSLTSLDVSNFNTSRVTNMENMFFGCRSLTNLNVSSFNTAYVTSMQNMFYNCSSLTSLDVSDFNTTQVTNMENMFSRCSSLSSLDLSGFYTRNTLKTGFMLSSMTSLRTLSVSNGLTNLLSWAACDKIGTDGNGNVTTPCKLIYPATSHVEYTEITDSYIKWKEGYFVTDNIKPYAKKEDGIKLTFCYDDYYAEKKANGTAYDLNTGTLDPGWYNIRENITSVEFNDVFAYARPTTCYNWFMGMKNLTSITGLNYLNTSNVTIMENMFGECSSLTNLDVSHFNTNKVNTMAGMFYNCSSLTSLDVSKFNTANVTNMYYMFAGCSALTRLDLSGFTTGSSTSTNVMLRNLTSLQALIVSPSLADYMADRACQGIGSASSPCTLTYPDNAHPTFSEATADYVVWKGGYFSDLKPYVNLDGTTLTFYCDNMRSARPGSIYNLNTDGNDTEWETAGTNTSVTKVVFDSSFANAVPTTTYAWFYGMTNLQSITGVEYLNTSNVTNMGWMFGRCSALTSLDLSTLNTANVTNMTTMFLGCSALTSIDLSSFNTANVTSMQQMFSNCSSLTTIYAGNEWNTDGVTNSNYMFEGCTKLVGGQGTTYNSYNLNKAYAHIDGGADNPGYFTSWLMPYAVYTNENTTLTFYYDEQRKSRPGTTFSLNTEENDAEWDTAGINANVTRVIFDFSFANARPTTTYDWFYGMRNLQSITGLEYLNTSEVTNMAWMFGQCFALKNIDLSHFNTANVVNMGSMFNRCEALEMIDLSNFNTANVTNMAGMFNACSSLTTIYAGEEWSTDALNISNNMFTACSKLVGGRGTAFATAGVDDGSYARIDGGASNPGYFTKKNGFLLGDVNGDGKVNVADVTALVNHLRGIAGDYHLYAADVDGNGKVTSADVPALVNTILGKE